MCHVLFLAADQPPRVIGWDVERRGFHSVPPEAREEVVARHFSKPHICYLGSHLQCGCGYYYPDRNPDGSIESDELEEWEEVRVMRERLVEYLRETIRNCGPVEVLLSWSGDEARPTERISDLTPEAFSAETFPLAEHQVVVVSERRL